MRVTTADRVRASARVTRRIVSRGGSRLANRFAWADRAVVAQVTAGHPDGSTARGARFSLERPFCRLGRIEAIWGLSWLSFNIRTSSIETVRILYERNRAIRHFKARNLYFRNLFYSNVFTLYSTWQRKDSFLLENGTSCRSMWER